MKLLKKELQKKIDADDLSKYAITHTVLNAMFAVACREASKKDVYMDGMFFRDGKITEATKWKSISIVKRRGRVFVTATQTLPYSTFEEWWHTDHNAKDYIS